MFVLLFVLAIAFFIMFHEFGHFATAKAFGMKVDEFFIGFGPRIWSFRRGETEYGIKALPAGGYVRIVGMNAAEEVDPADEGRLFRDKPAWQRLIVLVSGSATHLVVAAVLVFVALAVTGVPVLEDGAPVPSNEVGEVLPGSAAEAAGLQAGDRIVAVDGVATGDFDSVRAQIEPNPGETVTLSVQRDGEVRQLQATVGDEVVEGRRVGLLGVRPGSALVETFPVGEALRGTVSGDYSVPALFSLNLQGIVDTFSPDNLRQWLAQAEGGERQPEGLTSLVGAGQVVSALGAAGEFSAILLLLASLNIVLATLNMLPLPPLDGGHVAVLAVEQAVNAVRRLRGLPADWSLDPSVITPLALAVIILFGMLSLTAIYIDIVNPASNLLQ
ncbi:MAG TPA: site-2 protease family protein [Egibacteraceae bacterium]